MSWFARVFFITPLKNLYLHGPKFLGFWEGKENSDICEKISGVNSNFWKYNRIECDNMIDKKFNSLIVVIQVSFYFYFIFKFGSLIVSYYFWRQTMKSIKTLLLTLNDQPTHL